MVFLRPVIVRDASSTESLSLDRYDEMRAAQQIAQPRSSIVVPINEAPVLPEVLPPGLPPIRVSPPPAVEPPLVLPLPPQPQVPGG